MPREWYDYGDRQFKAYAKWAEKQFRKVRLTLPFDEINALTARKAVNRLYRQLDERLCAVMLAVARRAYRELFPDEGKPPDEDWLDIWLGQYNPVTKYVYHHETDRKRARFFESLIADAESGNRIGPMLDFKTALSLWVKQSEQYIADVEDAAAMKAYQDVGAARLKWVAELDGRECSVCRDRDGRIYPIDRVPGKPHYRCRCYLIDVSKEGNAID